MSFVKIVSVTAGEYIQQAIRASEHIYSQIIPSELIKDIILIEHITQSITMEDSI
jgi:hypothetical protein